MVETAEEKLIPLQPNDQTSLAHMTCAAMYGNGAQIGMATTAAIRRLTLLAQMVVRTMCFVAVAGAAVLWGNYARRVAAAGSRTRTVMDTLASAQCSRLSS